MWKALILMFVMLFVSPVLAQTEDDICTTPGLTTREIAVDDEAREYDLYVPDELAVPAPLVMSFHGFSGNPADQRGTDGWTALADEQGILVVYPRGTGFPLRWNTGDEGFRFSLEDDTGFVGALLDDLNGCFEAVYAVGFSNGGGMVNRLACEMADRLTAIGSVAGAYGTLSAGCNPSEPVPLIAFHGEEDSIVPYLGADSGFFTSPAVEVWFDEWAARNDCESTSQREMLTETVELITYDDCAAPVEFYAIENGDHVWFGSEAASRVMLGGVDEIDATQMMWDFFQSLNGDT